VLLDHMPAKLLGVQPQQDDHKGKKRRNAPWLASAHLDRKSIRQSYVNIGLPAIVRAVANVRERTSGPNGRVFRLKRATREDDRIAAMPLR
jgi:hypothetical protein